MSKGSEINNIIALPPGPLLSCGQDSVCQALVDGINANAKLVLHLLLEKRAHLVLGIPGSQHNHGAGDVLLIIGLWSATPTAHLRRWHAWMRPRRGKSSNDVCAQKYRRPAPDYAPAIGRVPRFSFQVPSY